VEETFCEGASVKPYAIPDAHICPDADERGVGRVAIRVLGMAGARGSAISKGAAPPKGPRIQGGVMAPESKLVDGLAEADQPSSRRALLKTLGAAAAGAAAGGMLSPTQALAHGGFHQDFNGLDPAIHGNNTGEGPGVEGTAVGSGVHGKGGAGVHAEGDFVGVNGESPNVGVHGQGSTGVHGDGSSVGVMAEGADMALFARTFSEGVGVFAQSIFALRYPSSK
jgi:hypothetical protein